MSRPRLFLGHAAFTAMREAAVAALPVEAGGILIGYRTGDSVVAHVVLAVPGEASHSHYRLREEPREHAFQHWLKDAPTDTPLGYVGCWHSHTANVGPSLVDRATLLGEARQTSDIIGHVVIATPDQPRLHGLLGSRWRTRRVEVDIVTG